MAANTDVVDTKLIRVRLMRAKLAVADLIPLFPDQNTDDAELGLITQAAEALQRLTDLINGR